MIRAGAAFVMIVALAGCGGDTARALARVGSSPIARANDGATAVVVLVACPTQVAGAQMVQEVINAAMAGGELAIASSGGTARVMIDTCPVGSRADARFSAASRPR